MEESLKQNVENIESTTETKQKAIQNQPKGKKSTLEILLIILVAIIILVLVAILLGVLIMVFQSLFQPDYAKPFINDAWQDNSLNNYADLFSK